MFYEVEVRSHIRVPPTLFKMDTKAAILEQLKTQFENFVSPEIGVVIGVTSIAQVGEGIIIPGDGAPYYDTTFKMLVFKPEMQELISGKITEITDFGCFINIGPIDGMIHVSQAMDDFVSFSKSNILTGKETKRTLKVGDICKARIIAVSYKDITNPKIGLTMRQPCLGKEEWTQVEKKELEVKVKEKEKK
ncbi:DNA-directed RNA polymerase [Candidatus Woesearchaeota archaeon]|nr:DNA-directed RNA polymerase [Candidatus Woesearchaeota archaeon]